MVRYLKRLKSSKFVRVKAFPMYGGIGVSAPSLHRESTDSLISAKWSYVTASPSHHDQAIPILSPLLFMHVGHPYIPLFKIQRIFDLLVSPPFLLFIQRGSNPSIDVYAHIFITTPSPSPPLFLNCIIVLQ